MSPVVPLAGQSRLVMGNQASAVGGRGHTGQQCRGPSIDSASKADEADRHSSRAVAGRAMFEVRHSSSGEPRRVFVGAVSLQFAVDPAGR
jgi:hypothetical protein